MSSILASTKSRGRPATGKGTQVVVRLQPDQLAQLDAWIGEQPTPTPTRPEAMRQILRTLWTSTGMKQGSDASVSKASPPTLSPMPREKLIGHLWEVVSYAVGKLVSGQGSLRKRLHCAYWDHLFHLSKGEFQYLPEKIRARFLSAVDELANAEDIRRISPRKANILAREILATYDAITRHMIPTEA